MLAVVILSAGEGKRMKSPLPKALHEAAGKPLLGHVLDAVAPLRAEHTVVIVGHEAEQVETYFRDKPVTFVRQDFSLGYGTGLALRQAEAALPHWEGELLVLNGDGPMIRTETLRELIAAQQAQGDGMTLLTVTKRDPYGAGRIIRSDDGRMLRIVEEKDSSEAEKRINEINPGLYVFDRHVFELASQLGNANASSEYYLTDMVDLYLRAGYPVQGILGDDENEVLGVNDREQLAQVERLLLARS